MIKVDVENNLVTMNLDDYGELFDSDLFLSILESNGAANWCGYDDAKHEFNEVNGE